MKSFEELEKILRRIDGKGYKAYKDLQGEYDINGVKLSIDYVQGDPFASPSRIRASIPAGAAGFPREYYESRVERNATIDFLSRTVARSIFRMYDRVSGSGKSGLLSIGRCGQEILQRNYIAIDAVKVEARMEVGLPAAGRRVLAREARKILLEAVPKIVRESLVYKSIDKAALKRQVELARDQNFMRGELQRRGLVSFIANGSVLPRESGVSQRPMKRGAVAFESPGEYEVEMELPNRGTIRGMGIPEGVTLIVGGGFHGKSTLLQAIELGVYDHIEGDGREYVVTRESAVKIKAENGRSVRNVNISPFINNLPMKRDTLRFSTENASGSTSQAANIMEALEIGTELFLIDEDTSATNFMIRDERMQMLVKKESEPITPFIDRVRSLYDDQGVSSILVIGGSGDYFEVADHVIMMEEYSPRDVTEVAEKILEGMNSRRKKEGSDIGFEKQRRVLSRSTFSEGKRGVKIKPRGKDQISYNRTDIDIRDLEQIVDSDQVNSICFIMQHIMKRHADDKSSMSEIVDRAYADIMRGGLDVVSPYKGHPGNMALARKHEIIGVLNRFRDLKIK